MKVEAASSGETAEAGSRIDGRPRRREACERTTAIRPRPERRGQLFHLGFRLPAGLLEHAHVVVGRQVGNEQAGRGEIERAVREHLEEDRVAPRGSRDA